MRHAELVAVDQRPSAELDFLWLELTNRCNLRCVHCYAESGPYTGDTDRLNRGHYETLLLDAHKLGCRRVQFIGGEPTLNRDIAALIEFAASARYTFIEVFSNLTRLSPELIEVFARHGVHVATSVYASVAGVHDAITLSDGSFERTIAALRILVERAIPVRAGVITMNANAKEVDRTIGFLRSIGVDNVGTDHVRSFGRAGTTVERDSLKQLCGSCSGKTLCVSADGRVSPCIMSKTWSVGSILDDELADLALSTQLSTLRGDIYQATIELPQSGERASIEAICTPKTCSPYESCGPKLGPGPCAPTGCNPCYPKG